MASPTLRGSAGQARTVWLSGVEAFVEGTTVLEGLAYILN
jgi:hypothetical protein